MSTESFLFHKCTVKELVEMLRKYADAQSHMAADSTEDSAHWHHVALSDLLREAANRILFLEVPE